MSSNRSKDNAGQADQLSAMMMPMNGAALSPVLMAQSLAQESVKFWARRMHAYADWAGAAAASKSPDQLLDAQNAFLSQTQKDYMQESAAMAAIVTGQGKGADRAT